MRKIYAGAFAMIAAMTVSAAVFAASTPMVTVKNEKSSSVSYTYDPSSKEETKQDASRLFSDFRDATSKDYVSHVFTVTSMSRNNTPIEIYFKLEAEPVSDVYSVLDAYEIKISDQSGNEIHHDDGFTDPGKSERIISLGTFNEQFTSDTKKFNVEYLLRDSMSHTVTKDDLSKLKVYIASKPIEHEASANTENNTAPPVVEVEATDAPAVSEAPVIFGGESQATPAASASASTPAPQTITKVCGTDITPGRYVVSGNGTVLIKSKKGETKSETVVTDGKTEGVKGVEQYVLTLEEGDQINMTALPGQEKPSIKFEKTNGAAATAATTAPKTAAKTATTTASKTNTNANANAKTNSKTNPKTGDSSVPVALLSIIMLGAAAAIGGIEIYKRKGINK